MAETTEVYCNAYGIPGLYFIPDYIINGEDLLSQIKSFDFHPISSASNSRRVKHFEMTYNYDRSGLSPADVFISNILDCDIIGYPVDFNQVNQ